ncbi:MAG: hypothetical protein JST86_10990 [Bacteroidetes bacterium]|nr:hypothetical protein [Bacteroidota bacterium]
MKTFRLALLLSITIMGSMAFTEVKAQNISVNFSIFQRELSPYGRWITNPRFGEVWIYNDANFRPYYTDGHWEYTNYGWAWVSDFDWGWAPFHYGRWEYDPDYGWMWIPGYDWGAAWVSWSSYDDYYGWAPLGYGVGINVSFGSIPYDRWTFIPRANICDRDIYRYYVAPNRNYGFRNAVIINNYYGDGGRNRFFRGPDRNDVQRYTHNNVQERRIEDRDRFNRWTANNGRGNGNGNFGGRRNDGSFANNDNGQRGNGNFDGQRNNDRQNNNDNNNRGNGNFGGRRNDGGFANNDNNGQRGNNNFPNRNDNANNNNNGNNGQRGYGNFPGRNDNNNNGQGNNNNRQFNNNNNGQRGNDNWGGRRNDNMNRQPQNNFPQQPQREQRPTYQQPTPPTRSMERRNDGGNYGGGNGGGFNRSQGQERQGGGNGGGNNGGGRGRRG